MGADPSGRYVYTTGGNYNDTLIFNKDSLMQGNSGDLPYIARWQPCADEVYMPPSAIEPCIDLFLPDAFSPNNDGQNDVLYVRGNCIKTMDFIIFDRWGNKLFESESVSVGWDGTYMGKPMNTGTYVYYLHATMYDGSTLEKHGNITLVR
jgi:gliding motility-associated-like protein